MLYDTYFTNGEVKVSWAIQQLADGNQEWVETIQGDGLSDWRRFKRLAKEHFASPLQRWYVHERINTIRQTDSLSRFVTEWEQLIGDVDESLEAYKGLFLCKLTPYYKELLLARWPEKLDGTYQELKWAVLGIEFWIIVDFERGHDDED